MPYKQCIRCVFDDIKTGQCKRLANEKAKDRKCEFVSATRGPRKYRGRIRNDNVVRDLFDETVTDERE